MGKIGFMQGIGQSSHGNTDFEASTLGLLKSARKEIKETIQQLDAIIPEKDR